MGEGDIFPSAPRVNVDVAGWLREGWRIFWTAPAVFLLSMAIIGVVLLTASKIPIFFTLAFFPLVVGFYLVAADVAAGRSFTPSRLFKGFAWFIPCILAGFLITLFSTIGALFLIIPGLIIYSWYLFTWLFMADRGLGFWDAMEASRKLTGGDTAGFFLFFVALIIVNMLGALCLFAGLFISLPVTATSIFAAYKETAGLKTLGVDS